MTATYDNQQMIKRLKQTLDEKGLSMRAASIGAGMGEAYLSNVITNGRDPQVTSLIAMCEYLDISLPWLLYGYDVPPQAEEIFQLLAQNPERTKAVLSLLRPSIQKSSVG